MKRFLYIITFLISSFIMGQQPTHVPSPQNNTPIDLNSWFDVVVFIVLPIVMIFLYFQWRRQVKKDKEADKNKDNS